MRTAFCSAREGSAREGAYGRIRLRSLLRRRRHSRRHPGLWGLLRQRDPEQALVLLATLAAWVVADSVAATGKPPRALTPPPADPQPAVVAAAGVGAGRATAA